MGNHRSYRADSPRRPLAARPVYDGGTMARCGEPTILKDGLYFPEGPRWRGDRLYFSDILAGTVHRLGLDGNLETIAAVDELPSGLGWLPDGTLQVVSLQDGRLLACRDGRIAAVAEMRRITGFPCNDMVIDRAGRAYVGSPDTDFGGGQALPGHATSAGRLSTSPSSFSRCSRANRTSKAGWSGRNTCGSIE